MKYYLLVGYIIRYLISNEPVISFDKELGITYKNF